MTFSKSTLLGAIAALGLTAGSASALTTITENGTTGAMTTTISAGTTEIGAPPGFFFNTTDITFDWTDTVTRAAGFLRFTVDTTFDLVLETYSGGGDGSQEFSGYIFSERFQPMLSNDYPGVLCSFGFPECNFVSNDPNSGLTFADPEGTALFTGLGAGEYYLGFEEINIPTSGTATFSIVEAQSPAPIPLPAGGWLLISALGGLGVMRARRKKADA